MKPLVFILCLHLSCFTYVYTIKCFRCDPRVDDHCKNIPINCREDEDLGQAFDACYINEIYAEDVNGTKYTHITKNCGIKDGCDQMRDIMCETINRTHDYLVKLECNVHCCDEHDYCNAERPRKNVQGYKSSSQKREATCIVVIFLSLVLALLNM